MLTLSVLKDTLAICRLAPQANIPVWVWQQSFFSATRTDDELSFVLPEAALVQQPLPDDWISEKGWRALKVIGPLDFSMVGVLTSLAVPLAQIKISIFVLSTYDTDYLLVRSTTLEDTCKVLRAQGFIILND